MHPGLDVTEIPALRLLTALDAFVRRDAAPSGLKASIAVGVRAGRNDHWWIWSSAGAGSDTHFAAELSPDVEAALLMGPEEATCILEGRDLPQMPCLLIDGDVDKIRKLWRRFLRKQNLLGLRAGRFDD